MSDMAYIMETQDPHELWLVDGEQRMRVSRDMYWLLVSQGADLPPLHDISDLLAENAKLRSMRDTWQENDAKLRELVVALYHIKFGTEEESWDVWEDFCPCGICEERHGGEAPCAYTAKDLADECCEPITKEIVTDRMRELGIEVSE